MLATRLALLELGLSEDRDRELERKSSALPCATRVPVRRVRGHG